MWAGLKGYVEAGGDEAGGDEAGGYEAGGGEAGGREAGGREAGGGQLVSPRPSELTTIEVDVLCALATCGDYTTFSPTKFTMKRGRAERNYTPKMLKGLCTRVGFRV